jgi:HD-GYP domain-containing protein (c-di-GMP phosphodiesterase class II)
MDKQLAIAQALKYAQELRVLHAAERKQRRAAEETLEQLEQSYVLTVRSLARALELRDDETGGHAERVTRLALQLTERAAPELAAEPQLEYGFLLHDIGKIGVRDQVLRKPGPLDADELEEMRSHTILGEQMIDGIPYLSGVAREVVASHHERWDGRGYPRGLEGAEIPLGARIFAVVDAFDAMTNDRPYRKAMRFEEAIAEIVGNAGTQFQPELAHAFVELARERSRAA